VLVTERRHLPVRCYVRSGMVVVDVRGLTKTYGATRAVDDLSFQVEAGEVYALLGPNGAGKTTTVEILEGHRDRTAGVVEVLGHDPRMSGPKLRDRIGIVLQSSGLEHELSVAEALDVYGSPYRRRRDSDELLGLVGLSGQRDQRIRALSGGQRRRLDLALALVGHPELLFLDEPTTGFDPAARRSAWELVRRLCAGGTTVLLTTHYLDEVEHLADRMGVLVGGRMVAEGTPAELTAGVDTRTTVRFSLPDGASAAGLAGAVPGDAVVNGTRVEFSTDAPTAAVHAVTGWALQQRIELVGLTVARPSLEDVFLGLIGPDHPDAQTADP